MNTPIAEQPRIVLFGLRNAGKSSLFNNFFEKDVAIVSPEPGTTTDPVTRSFELGKLGPVAVTDTAGLDDEGELGGFRMQKSLDMLAIADIAVLVTRADQSPTTIESNFVQELLKRKKPVLLALSYADKPRNSEKEAWELNLQRIYIDNKGKTGLLELKQALEKLSLSIEFEITPLEGLVRENDLLVLVTPIDLAAPKGRLILPQVETLRDALDRDCAALVVKERELARFYALLKEKPRLVITDSQAFSKVAADIPSDQPLTSFSILFARKKGDLALYVEGARLLHSVPPGVKILMLESCSHHRQADDIGTVKIPRLFRQLVQSDAEFEFSRELPEEGRLSEYYMVINCAGCMVSRNKILNRLEALKKNHVAALNYGLFLAWVNGLLPRALEPFPFEYELYQGHS